MKYLIYALVDPETQEIRYIGKSSYGLDRPKAHFWPYNYKQKRYVYNWIRPLIERGVKPEIRVLEVLPSPENLYEREQWYIARYRSIGAPLTNLSDGGPGCAGPKSLELRKRISATLKGRPAPPRSAEHRANLSKSQIGKIVSEKARLNMAKSKGGRSFMDQNGNVYETINGAARQLGITATAICAILKRKPGRKNTKGYTFKYVDDENWYSDVPKPKRIHSEESKLKNSKSRGGRPFVDQNGQIYQTINGAGRQLGISPVHISEILRGKRKSAKGYTFKHLNLDANKS